MIRYHKNNNVDSTRVIDIRKYKQINPSSQNLTDKQIIAIFFSEFNMKSNIDIFPDDFDIKLYRIIVPETEKMSDIELIKKCCDDGEINPRYKELKLPKKFDVCVYKELNNDLKIMSDHDAIKHYVNSGKYEGRKYIDKYFDKQYFAKKYCYDIDDINLYSKYIADIRQEKCEGIHKRIAKMNPNDRKKYIILVNHDDSIYGASIYIYYLFLYLKKKYHKDNSIKVNLATIRYDTMLFDKFGIHERDVIEYHNEPTLLCHVYLKYKPKIFYLNSCNDIYTKIYPYLNKNNVILHSHEVCDHYFKDILPDYVVSDRIAHQYRIKCHKPNIQPPVLFNIDEIFKLCNEPIDYEIKNAHGVMNNKNINIGMCGSICQRKGYNIFIEISKQYPNHNFIWLGGEKTNVFNGLSNVYHIYYEANPFKYYRKIFDYFILFSLIDPCPYVVLENILVETNIITFKNNIFADHTHELTKLFYKEMKCSISIENCKKAIDTHVKNKKSIYLSGMGREYIEKYFHKLSVIEKHIEDNLASSWWDVI